MASGVFSSGAGAGGTGGQQQRQLLNSGSSDANSDKLSTSSYVTSPPRRWETQAHAGGTSLQDDFRSIVHVPNGNHQCAECCGVLHTNYIHPPLSHLRGQPSFFSTDGLHVRNNYKYYYHDPNFKLEAYHEFVRKMSSKYPYHYVHDERKPSAAIDMVFPIVDEDNQELIEETKTERYFRGAPNITSRGGGLRAFWFGRGEETHQNGRPKQEQTSIRFATRRDYLQIRTRDICAATKTRPNLSTINPNGSSNLSFSMGVINIEKMKADFAAMYAEVAAWKAECGD